MEQFPYRNLDYSFMFLYHKWFFIR